MGDGKGNGQGPTADAAVNDAATGLAPGEYDAKITGKVKTGGGSGSEPTPIGDYRASLKAK